jgi:hypothetical protein
MDISLIVTLVKRLGMAFLAFVILWHVAQHAGQRRGRAIVHVSQPDVMVDVDDRSFHVGSLTESPVVCDLEPGPHRAEVWRNGRMVGEQRFAVEAGQDIVVYPITVGAVASGPDRSADRAIDADLAVRTPRPSSDPTRD